jgi:hypothetical protein
VGKRKRRVTDQAVKTQSERRTIGDMYRRKVNGKDSDGNVRQWSFHLTTRQYPHYWQATLKSCHSCLTSFFGTYLLHRLLVERLQKPSSLCKAIFGDCNSHLEVVGIILTLILCLLREDLLTSKLTCHLKTALSPAE